MQFDPELGWSDVAGGGLETHAISGSHITMLREPQVETLARRLSECLARAE